MQGSVTGPLKGSIFGRYALVEVAGHDDRRSLLLDGMCLGEDSVVVAPATSQVDGTVIFQGPPGQIDRTIACYRGSPSSFVSAAAEGQE